MSARARCIVLLSILVGAELGFNRSGELAAQGQACDPQLEQPPTHPYGYRLRGDRCEGVYIRQVAGTTLLIASFTERFDTYDLGSDRELAVEWNSAAGSPIRLRAYALQRRLYYRMDSQISSANRSFRWPLDVVAALNIPRAELGVVGWARMNVNRSEREVYLPLRVGPANVFNRSSSYTLVVLPGSALSELFVSIAPLDQNGNPANFIRDDEPLGYIYYPADRPIDIAISRPASPGIYYVLLGAKLQRSGSATAELWFYESGQ